MNREELIVRLKIISILPDGNPEQWQRAYEWAVRLRETSQCQEVNIVEELNDIEPCVVSAKEAEKMALVNALRSTGFNIRKAAEALGVSERTVHRKLKEYNLHK